MSGLPTVQVLLDDGTGTYPFDITGFTEGAATMSRGRANDEFAQAQAETLSLTLDNSDGSLTGAGAGFGVGPFGVGPFGVGAVTAYPGQGIQVKLTLGATTVTRFTGRLTELQVGWPGGGDDYATVQLAASDVLADLSRRQLRSMLEEEYLLRSPSSYYTLAESEGSTSAGDTSGNGAAPLTVSGTGAAPSFGTGIGPGTDGLSATQFFGSGQMLYRAATTASMPVPTTFGVGAIFQTTTAAAGILSDTIVSAYFWSLTVDSSGRIIGTAGPSGAITGPVVTDGHTHVAAIESHDGVTATLWLDGVSVGTIAVAGGFTTDAMSVGGTRGLPLTTFTGTISHVATWPGGLPAGSAAAITNAATGVAESVTARFARIASYVGLTTSTTAGMSAATVGAQSTSGLSALDAMQSVATLEGGVLYANGSGLVVLQGRNYRGLKTTPNQTFTTDSVGEDTTVTFDTQQILNRVTVTPPVGPTQEIVNEASIGSYGEYSTSVAIPGGDDDDALYLAQWLTATHGDPSIRLESATFKLHEETSTAAQQMLQREIGDRLQLSLPAQSWTPTFDVTLEGWEESIDERTWTLTANLLPWDLFSAFILDSATYGVLEGSTPIGY